MMLMIEIGDRRSEIRLKKSITGILPMPNDTMTNDQTS